MQKNLQAKTIAENPDESFDWICVATRLSEVEAERNRANSAATYPGIKYRVVDHNPECDCSSTIHSSSEP